MDKIDDMLHDMREAEQAHADCLAMLDALIGAIDLAEAKRENRDPMVAA